MQNYLDITPAEFFNDKSYSAEMIELIKDLENISPELLAHIHVIVRNLRKEPFEDL